MLKVLKEFFHSTFIYEEQQSSSHDLELAAAVLMMEISLADSVLQDEERQLMEQSMRDHFHLSAEEAETLVSLARRKTDHAVSLYEFTRKLNETLAPGQRIAIVELLWRVALADTVIDKYEEYFVRKIADLLYVSHSDYIKAKHKAGA